MSKSDVYSTHAQICDDAAARSHSPELTEMWQHCRRSWQILIDQEAREDARKDGPTVEKR